MFKGIWQHKEIRAHSDNIKPELYFSLEEGDTPINKFIDDNRNKIIIKREDLNPTGSWKDRASAYKISSLISDNKTEAVIASSGNAAISLLTYLNELFGEQKIEFKLNVVVSPDISAYKKEKILNLAHGTIHEIYFDKNAKSLSVKISNEKKIPLLKTSIDMDILKAYWSLGFELFREIKHEVNKKNILISAASSGTALVGLTEGLFSKIEDESKMPQIIAVQTQSCHPLVERGSKIQDTGSQVTQNSSVIAQNSLADSIVDKSMLRKPQIEKILLQTNGEAFVITNEELLAAKDYATDIFDLDLSYTSLLSIAAYLKLKNSYHNANFILITSGT